MTEAEIRKREAGNTGELDFLTGGGEMGARMRAHDWAATALGAVGQWPQSLKTAVSVLVNSLYPMFIAWGPKLVFLYNDGYRPIFGAKHPAALGQPFAEIWAEIWGDIEPLVDRALAGEATWSDDLCLFMERSGYLEETYFTFSYSPVRDETGGVGGMFCACTETTGKVVGDRRLRCLRDLSALTADTRTTEDAARLCLRILESYSADIPFALLYQWVEGGPARLMSCASVEAGGPAAPLSMDGDSPLWPVTWSGAPKSHVVNDIASRVHEVPRSIWGDPVDSAVVVPISERGQAGATSALVLGVNPRRRLDDDYRSFFNLVASHIETAIANAGAFEEERRRAEALAELDHAKTLFFSNISHEFRTPLTLMLGPLKDAIDHFAADRPAEERDQLDLAYRNGLRLLKLVNTLLDFSRIEAGRARAVFQPTDLAQLTADLSSNFRSACERAGLELIIDCPPLPEAVRVDREMWEKIVLNLLSNAFKFTFEGAIAVSLRSVENAAELTIRDTGVGISEEDLGRIFERFQRIEGTRGRTHEGSGIGLSLVDELVRLHGGTVRVESEEGKGSIFRVSIPYGTDHLPESQLAADEMPQPESARPDAFVEEALRWLPAERAASDSGGDLPDGPKTAEAAGDRPRILWADDNADMRDYVRRLLSGRYDVEAVADGEAALAAMHRRKPDLVLSDIMMPGIGGLELLAQIRSEPSLRDLPVILLSARAGEEAKVEGLGAGADDYLVKPFSSLELLARVAAHLSTLRMRREAASALVESETRYRLATHAASDVIWDWNIVTGEVRWNETLRTAFGYGAEDVPVDFGGARTWWTERIHPGDLQRVRGTIDKALQDGSTRWREEYRFRRADDSVAVVMDRGFIERDAAGEPVRMVGAMADVTDYRQAENQRQLLLDELNHRVKNALATVQSIAQQTLKGAAPIAEERNTFEGRLIALSRVHNLLTQDKWTGAAMREIVFGELAPYGAGESASFEVAGPNIRLNPKAALALGMAFHELATNAAKYGALSRPTGRVDVKWQIADQGDAARLQVHWSEAGGPPVTRPGRTGFGSMMIKRGLVHDLGGQVELDFQPDGVVCTMNLPLSRAGDESGEFRNT